MISSFLEDESEGLKKISVFNELPKRTQKMYISIERILDKEEIEKNESIYSFFKEFTKKEVDDVLEELNTSKKNILKARYDEKYEFVINDNKELSVKFYNNIIIFSKTVIKRQRKIYNDYLKYIKFKNMDINDIIVFEILKKLSTKERIRQIEADALQKIRSKKDVYNLIDYTDNESKSREYILKARENYYSKKRHTKTDSNFIKSDIYDFFPELDKNEVDKEVIEKLSLDDLQILHIRFGDDFNNPILNKNWTKEEQKSFYKLIYREKAKVKRYIKNRKKNS